MLPGEAQSDLPSEPREGIACPPYHESPKPCDTFLAPSPRRPGESGFIQRERKLTGATFAKAVVFGWLANPEATCSERAQAAAACGVPISPQGLEESLDDERAPECLRRVLEAAMGEVVVAASPVAIPVLERFSGVYLYDGTVVALPDELKEVHPGCGGGHGREAAVKAGARLELLGGELHLALGAGRSHDRTLELGAQQMPEGALRLAFFDLGLLGFLSAGGRHWLTRLMAGTAVYDKQSGGLLNLPSLLGAHEDGEVELRVEVGQRARLPARLLAVRVSEEVANERRRRLRKEATQRRQPVSAKRMAGWTILVTNTPPRCSR